MASTQTPALRATLRRQADPTRARHVARFFKCGRGEYGEGDRFLGVTVPAQRIVARQFRDLSLADVEALLQSPIHEERLTALLILVDQFRRHEALRASIVRLYLRRLRWVNNWDLVDTSAPQILGSWLVGRPRDRLDRMARSNNLWQRRIAMVATYRFILDGDSADAIRIATILLEDEHDLIHKAVGWMLREVGKRVGEDVLRGFLTDHAATMPRTMLRYAIERFPPQERALWLTRRVASVAYGPTKSSRRRGRQGFIQ